MNATLEQRLEQVKKIKFFYGGRYYVGTQEALNYVRGLEQIETRPQAIADAVNANLKNPEYQATPERVVSTLELLHDTDQNLAKREIYILNPRECENPFYNFDQNTRTIEYGIKPRFITLLTGMFREANKSKVKNDKEFYDFLVHNYLPREIQKRAKLVKLPRLNGKEFDFNVKYEEAKAAAYSSVAMVLDRKEIIKRMQRDKVELQTEHQRAIVDNYLNNGGFATIAEKEEIPTDVVKAYSILVNAAMKRIERRMHILDSLKAIRAPQFILRAQEDMLNESKALRQALGREKSYVFNRLEKYLVS